MKRFLIFLTLICSFPAVDGNGQNPQEQSKPAEKKTDHQIYFKKPIKEINHIMYDRSFLPIQGEISEDKKSVVLKNWEKGTKVRVKVTYEDGTEDEIVKSPCYIDPVIL
jgi:hypothetical protein